MSSNDLWELRQQALNTCKIGDLTSYKEAKVEPSMDHMDAAIENGHLEIAEYLASLGTKGSESGVIKAVCNHHLNTVVFAVERGYPITSAVLDCAAIRGHFDIMGYFLSLRKKLRFSRTAVTGAQAAFRDDVVAWLRKNTPYLFK